MNKIINIAVVGLGQVGIYLLNELNSKKKDIEIKTGKKIKVVAVSARNINKKRQFKFDKKLFYLPYFNHPDPSVKRKSGFFGLFVSFFRFIICIAA